MMSVLVVAYLVGGLLWAIGWGSYAVRLTRRDFFAETDAPLMIAATSVWPLVGAWMIARRALRIVGACLTRRVAA